MIRSGRGQAALGVIGNGKFDVVITDLRLGDIDGMEVLSKTRRSAPETEVVVITAFGTINSAVRAMKLGAYEYITKPVQRDQILSIIGRIAEERHGTGTSRAAALTVSRRGLQEFIGRNPKVLSLLEL